MWLLAQIQVFYENRLFKKMTSPQLVQIKAHLIKTIKDL